MLFRISTTNRVTRTFEPVGDINGDGFIDLILSVDNEFFSEDEEDDFVEANFFVNIYSGQDGTVLRTLDVPEELNPGGEAFFTNSDIANLGDVNNDGFDDIAIRVSGLEIPDSVNPTGVLIYSVVDGSVIYSISAEVNTNEEFSLFAASIESAGDQNGDGITDLLIYSNADFGVDDFLSLYSGIDGVLIRTYSSIEREGEFSRLVYNSNSTFDSAGDVDGDGFDDTVVFVDGVLSTSNFSSTRRYGLLIHSGFDGSLLYEINDDVLRTNNRSVASLGDCLLYTSPSPRDQRGSRMPSSA